MADLAVIRFTVVVPARVRAARALLPEEADQYLETLVRDPSRRSYAIELREPAPNGAPAAPKHVATSGSRTTTGPLGGECFIELGERSAPGTGSGTAP